MKKTILTVVLSVLLGVTAYSQRKIATDKLQVKSLPNVGVLGTDAKGNVIESAVLLNYQKKTDNALQTTNKTVVGAINELKGSSNTPNIQQVLTKGNRATKNIKLENNAYDNFSILRNDKLVLYHDGCMGDCSGIENLNLDSDNNRLEEDDLLTVIKPSSISLKNTTRHPHAPNNTAEQGVVITPNIIKQYGYKNSSGSEIISSVSAGGFNIRYYLLAGTTYDRNKIIVARGTENLKNTVNLELPVFNTPATSSEIFNKRVIFPAPIQNVDTVVYKSKFNDLKTIKFNPITAPTAPTKGTIYFDSSDNKLKCYDGTAWQSLW